MAEETKVTAEVTAEPIPEVPAKPEAKTPEIDYKAEYEKVKAAMDKAASDAARYKKELSDRSTKEENDRREREERDREREQELETLRTERRVWNYTNLLMGTGINQDTASKLAAMLPDGVPSEFFAALKTFVDETSSRVRAEALNQQPKPTVGVPINASEQVKPGLDPLRKAFGFKD